MAENVGDIGASIEAMVNPDAPDSLLSKVQAALDQAAETHAALGDLVAGSDNPNARELHEQAGHIATSLGGVVQRLTGMAAIKDRLLAEWTGMSGVIPSGISTVGVPNIDKATPPVADVSPQAYAEAFRRGETVRLPADSGLRGRIVRGIQAGDFEHLASDGRRLVFAMGPDGLEQLPGRSLRAALDTIGLPPRYVQGRIDQGHFFKFVVFEGDDEAPRATWDNVLDMVTEHYPELSEDVAAHRAALKEQPFAYFAQQMAPHNMDQIQLDGPANPLFMSLERYLVLPREVRLREPLALRRLLLHEIGLGTDYTGDGHTAMSGGRRGIEEYIVPNRPVSGLHGPEIVDLSLGDGSIA